MPLRKLTSRGLRPLPIMAVAALTLSACAQGPQFVSIPESWARAGTAADDFARARSASPTGSAYAQALYEAEVANMAFEFEEMSDWGDTSFYAQRVEAAAAGNPLPPQAPSERILPPESVGELTDAHNRLVAALDGTDVKERLPLESALATANYNCWLEQQEENFQPNDIARCKDAFYANLEILETPVEVEEVASPDPDFRLAGEGFFAFDDASVKPAFAARLEEIVGEIRDSEATVIEIIAHTDDIGTEEYNLDLSERRAAAVAAFLAERGVDPNKMVTIGMGESQPIVPNDSPENRQQNRRADIFLK